MASEEDIREGFDTREEFGIPPTVTLVEGLEVVARTLRAERNTAGRRVRELEIGNEGLQRNLKILSDERQELRERLSVPKDARLVDRLVERVQGLESQLGATNAVLSKYSTADCQIRDHFYLPGAADLLEALKERFKASAPAADSAGPPVEDAGDHSNMKAYSLAGACYKGREGLIYPFFVIAHSLEEATGVALKKITENSPRSAGWRDHQVHGTEVTLEVLSRVTGLVKKEK